MDPETILGVLRAAARDAGFDHVAAAPAGRAPHEAFFRRWLAGGHDATMAYIGRNADVRVDPRERFDWVRSIVSLAVSYRHPDEAVRSARGRVARYAWGRDYHRVIEGMLKQLLGRLERDLGPGVLSSGRYYVDTGPVLERDFAARAGLGWFGKNTNLLHRDLGSFFFVATLLLPVEVPEPEPLADLCGSCTACLDACPTGALPEPYLLDAGRCVSYLTIEHRGPIPTELRAGAGEWVFGCDACQDVCPWNCGATRATFVGLEPVPAVTGLDALELLVLDDAGFRKRFQGTALLRAKRSGLLRNAAIMLGNRREEMAVPLLCDRLDVEPDATVRGAIAWALGEIGGNQATQALADSAGLEPDKEVRAEIQRALRCLRERVEAAP